MIAGNWGLNSQMKASETETWGNGLEKDFDQNLDSIDPFLCCYIQGHSYPYVSRDGIAD